jgi:hypothetical protein
MRNFRYTVTLIATQKMPEAVRLGLADIITDVVEAEDVELAEAVLIEWAPDAPTSALPSGFEYETGE